MDMILPVFIFSMTSKFKFLLLYFISWVLFFELMRISFLLYHLEMTSQLTRGTALSTLWYGMKMDLSVAAYILAPVCVFVLLSLALSFFRRPLVYKVYTFIILLLILLLSIADLEVYAQWGFRIDTTPLKFLSTPTEALASVSHLPLFWFAIGFVVVVALFFFVFNKIIRKIFFGPQTRFRIVTAFLILLLMGSLIIPIRGGFQLAPLNQSSVYFSTNNYANHAAINASWNFLHSLVSKGSSGKNPYRYLQPERLKMITDSLYASSGKTYQFIRSRDNDSVNILFIIWESFTEKVLDLAIEQVEVTPHFNRLRNEGVYFSNAFASGDRTNKGIPAILSGYPAMPATTIIHSPAKSQTLQVLSKFFKEKGYSSPFFYGGEPEFANIKSYLLYGGFDPIIGKDDFDEKDMNSKWGAHDGVVMTRVISDINKAKQPFFATWLTLTSHEPFETPVPPVFSGNDNTNKFLNSMHYTDVVVHEFIEECKRQPWWKNTVVVITGDHGHPLPKSENKADDFRIPILFLGGVVEKAMVVDKVVSQLDIASTLTRQLGFKGDDFPFSRNMADSTAREWAFFTFNNGFGLVDSTGTLIYDNVGKQPIHTEGGVGEAQTEAGKALMQWVYGDFISR